MFNVTRVNIDPPWQRELLYPARGRANLTQPAAPDTDDSLGPLLGQTRAHLLRDLDRPATTTQLTRQRHLSLGAAGHHLSVLRKAGLISGIRDGQSVVYHRTKLGDALAEQQATD